MFQSYAESLQSNVADTPHLVLLIMVLFTIVMIFTFTVLLRKFLIMLKTPTTPIKEVKEGMLAEVGGVLAPVVDSTVLTEPFKQRNVTYLSIKAGVTKKRIPFINSRKRRPARHQLAYFENGSKDFFLIKDETGDLIVANESFMNGLSTLSGSFTYKKKNIPQEVLNYFPNTDLMGQNLITGWRLRYYFHINYIPCDKKVFGIGRVKTIGIDGTPQKTLHGGEYIDQKRLMDKFFKKTLNSELIVEMMPDQHEIQTVTAAGKDSSRKERERAQIDYGGQARQLSILAFQAILMAAIALPLSGFTILLIYSKYFL